MNTNAFSRALAVCAALLAAGHLLSSVHAQEITAAAFRAQKLTLDDPLTPASPGLVLTFEPDGGAGHLGLFTLPDTAEWQWRLGDAPGRLQMSLSPDHVLSLFDPTSTSSRLELAPGYDTPEGAVPTTLTLTHPGEAAAHAIVLTTGPTPTLTLGGQPVVTAAQLAARITPSSIAAGAGASTQGNGSFALGWGTLAAAPGQLAIGRWNLPSGFPDLPFGGDALLVVGNGVDSMNRSNAFEIMADGTGHLLNSLIIGGPGTWARPGIDGKGPSLVLGVFSGALADCSVAMGREVTAHSDYTFTAGSWNHAIGWASVSLGSGNHAVGASSFASGWQNSADGWGSTATGHFSTAAGDLSFAGNSSTATGHYSATFGLGTDARSYSQFVVGRFNKLEGNPTSWSLPGPSVDLFIIGNGTAENARSNAFSVQNNGDVRAAGVIRVKEAGDLSMGDFRSEPLPTP